MKCSSTSNKKRFVPYLILVSEDLFLIFCGTRVWCSLLLGYNQVRNHKDFPDLWTKSQWIVETANISWYHVRNWRLTIFPARMPQVSILVSVLDWAILMNSGTRLPGIITFRRPALMGDRIRDGFADRSKLGIFPIVPFCSTEYCKTAPENQFNELGLVTHCI